MPYFLTTPDKGTLLRDTLYPLRKAMGAKQKAEAKKELAAKRRNGIACKLRRFPKTIYAVL